MGGEEPPLAGPASAAEVGSRVFPWAVSLCHVLWPDSDNCSLPFHSNTRAHGEKQRRVASSGGDVVEGGWNSGKRSLTQKVNESCCEAGRAEAKMIKATYH